MKSIAAFATSVVALFAGMAMASEDIGEIKAVIDSASASGTVGSRMLAVGSRVFLRDKVNTDAQGEAQLLFNDGTRMVVGPNASLVVDDFIFRSQAGENKFALRAHGGAFRFISGTEKPGEGYLIHTPAATIGVRGTVFDFTVQPSDTSLVLLEGMATLCGGDGSCVTVQETCELVRADRGQGAETVSNPAERVRQTRELFPYLDAQDHLAETFRVPDQGCTVAVAAAAVPTGDEASSEASPSEAPQSEAPQSEAAPSEGLSSAPASENDPDPAPEPGNTGSRSGLADGTNPGIGFGPGNSGGTSNSGDGSSSGSGGGGPGGGASGGPGGVGGGPGGGASGGAGGAGGGGNSGR